MIGIHAMATKRRRNTRLATALSRPDPLATPERMAKAEGCYELGDDRQGAKVLTMRDSPIERAKNRKAITEAQYNAGIKYRHHHWHARLAGSVGGFDLDRVFGGGAGFSGLACSENAVFHKQRYYEARDRLEPLYAAVVEAVVCQEKPLAQIGFDLKWKSEPKAIQAVELILRDSLQKLVVLWGL